MEIGGRPLESSFSTKDADMPGFRYVEMAFSTDPYIWGSEAQKRAENRHMWGVHK